MRLLVAVASTDSGCDEPKFDSVGEKVSRTVTGSKFRVEGGNERSEYHIIIIVINAAGDVSVMDVGECGRAPMKFNSKHFSCNGVSFSSVREELVRLE